MYANTLDSANMQQSMFSVLGYGLLFWIRVRLLKARSIIAAFRSNSLTRNNCAKFKKWTDVVCQCIGCGGLGTQRYCLELLPGTFVLMARLRAQSIGWELIPPQR